MNALSHLLTSPLRGWAHLLRLLRDPHARLVAALFFALIASILGLGYMYTVNTGFGFFNRGCATGFSEGRIAALLMLTPIAFALALSSVGEAIRWMDAKRLGRHYNLRFFWKLAVLGGVLLLAVFLLGRC
ncbi:MAG: hypothetical protein Q8Q28_03170 [Pseudomonadota bacterium]|nr:hypothetical protein [Pseudomonadota bacterium]